jgi:predicted lipase
VTFICVLCTLRTQISLDINMQLRFYSVTGMPLHVFCTGHSLGGALATLCALEMRQRLGLRVELYTFGSPRVGSPQFAR